MEKTLKPCPFCGEKRISLWPMAERWYSPLCQTCGATINENTNTGPVTSLQIAAWNRRAAKKKAKP
jgi:hypothetical protein